jgi:predicted transposase YbfD/YdcC
MEIFGRGSPDELAQARLALLIERFSELSDDREPHRIMYPLHEALLLVTCATIASCDGASIIWIFCGASARFTSAFPARAGFAPSSTGDPTLFARCFESWTAALWPERHDLIAIDGKTGRRTHDKRKGLKALHTLSAYAANARLTLAQLSVPEKTNEITAIPDLLSTRPGRTARRRAGYDDAMGCQVAIADKIVAHGADYLLGLKGNQPILEGDVAAYFDAAPETELATKTTVEKGRGRIDARLRRLRRRRFGSPRIEVILVRRASPTLRPSSSSSRASNTPTAAASRRAISSRRPPATSNASPPRRAAIGAWRACTGCSTPSSRTT